MSDLTAAPDVVAKCGAVAQVDARSYARPDPTHETRRHGNFLPHGDPMAGYVAEQSWDTGLPPDPQPYLTVTLAGVAALTLDLARAGLAGWPPSTSPPPTIAVATDTAAQVTLAALPPGVTVELDGHRPVPRWRCPWGGIASPWPAQLTNAIRHGGWLTGEGKDGP